MEQHGSAGGAHSTSAHGDTPNTLTQSLRSDLIPDHKLLHLIGRGSYGSVGLAVGSTGIYRAVKIVYRSSFDNPRPFEREWSGIRKFEPISRSHEGFVDVLHVGIKEGEYFYYVMELGDDEIHGQAIHPDSYKPKTLGKEISTNGRQTFDDCLKLGIALSQALSELHKHGLVHRDVKPSNIIYVNGVPKLADIGLVADANEARSYVGTEGFIPPEGPGSVRADVYSLGKVLYEAATGKDRHEFPELPTLLGEFPDQEKFLELNEVILKACKPDPNERYLTAWEMCSDLLVLANGKSVKRLMLLEKRLIAYKRIFRASVGVSIIIALVVLIIYRERKMAFELTERRIGANVADGTRAMNTGNCLDSLPYFATAISLDKDAAGQRENRLRFASALAQCPKIVQMWFAPKPLRMAVFDPVGEKILQIEDFGEAKIFDVRTGLQVSSAFGQSDGLCSGAFSADGLSIVTASQDKTAIIWNASNLTEKIVLKHPDKVLSAAFSPDSRQLVTGCDDNIARVWNASSGDLEMQLVGHNGVGPNGGVLFVTYSHDGKKIATTGRDNTARIWDSQSGEEICSPIQYPSWPNCAAFSPDDSLLATACSDRKARIWDLTLKKIIPPLMSHEEGISSIQFSSDGKYLLTGGLDRTARLWSASDHSPDAQTPILRHSDRVTCASFASNGHQILTSCADGTTRIWDLAGRETTPNPIRHSFSRNGEYFVVRQGVQILIESATDSNAQSLAIESACSPQDVYLNSDGSFALAVCRESSALTNDQKLQVYNARDGKPAFASFNIPGNFTNIALSLDGLHLLAVGDNSVQAWGTPEGRPSSSPIFCSNGLRSATLSPTGKQIAVCEKSNVWVIDAETGRESFPKLEHEALICHAEFSPSSTRLLTWCRDDGFTKCSARVWDAKTGRLICPPLKHQDGVLWASFSPDENRVVTASEDYTSRVWDVRSGRPLTPALIHSDQVRMAVFCRDGKWVATASADRTARIWSAVSGEPLTPPLRHPKGLISVALLAEGKELLTRDKFDDEWIWVLPMNRFETADIQDLAELLVNEPLKPDDSSVTIGSRSLCLKWHRLRQQYPSEFNISEEDIARWKISEGGQFIIH